MRNLLTLDEQLNEASSAFKHAVQKAIKAAGYNLKQSEFKVGIKKDGPFGYKVSLNGAYLGNDDNMDVMVSNFTKYIKEDPEKYGLKESVNEAKKKIKPGTEIHWPTNHKNKALHGRSGYIEKIKGKNALMNMHDNADDESMWIPVPIKDLPVNEGLENYSLLDFFKEMQSFPAAGVDRDDIKDASQPKNKKKTVKNTPALKSLLDQWMSGRFDEDPGYLVNDLRDLLESRNFTNIQTFKESVNEASGVPRSDKAIKDLEKQGSEINWLDDADAETKKIWKKAGVNTDDENTIILYSYVAHPWDDVKKIMKNNNIDFKELEDPNSAGESMIVFVKESVNEGDQMNGEYLMQMLKVQANDIKRDEPKTAAALMYIYDRIYQSARDEDLSVEDVNDFLNEPRGRKHSLNLPEWMITDLFVESFIMKEELNEGEILVWDRMEGPFSHLKNALDKITKENTDPKWSKALLSVWKQIEKAEETLNNHDRKLGAITIKEDVNEKKVPPNDETIKFHIDSYRVDDDPYDVAKEIGSQYNWTEKEIEKAEKILRKKYLK